MNSFVYQDAQRGTSIIEFITILPMLLLILWGVVIFTTALHAQMIITRAAEDAARSVSFFSGAGTHEELAPFLVPCTAPNAPSVQCEALASLAHSSLVKGTGTAERFARLQDEVRITVTANVCGAENNSLGVEVRVPLELIRILPPLRGFSSWIPNDLTACAVIAL